MVKKSIDVIEKVFVTHLGYGSSVILERNLRDLGLTRDTFRKKDIDLFLARMLGDYDKLLGNHVEHIRKEIYNKIGN